MLRLHLDVERRVIGVDPDSDLVGARLNLDGPVFQMKRLVKACRVGKGIWRGGDADASELDQLASLGPRVR